MKILIDTNLWISALISQATRKRITKILSNDTIMDIRAS
jgi:predicted nucleic acid-binding protein